MSFFPGNMHHDVETAVYAEKCAGEGRGRVNCNVMYLASLMPHMPKTPKSETLHPLYCNLLKLGV
jgi:hypothetical protein